VGPDSAISGYLVDPAMVRDVNSGVSALIDPNGRLLAKKLRGRADDHPGRRYVP
jgi:hypothetical protein